MSGTTEIKVKDACEKITGEKFCTECQKTRKMSAGGVWKVSSTRRRWICATCVENKKNLKRG